MAANPNTNTAAREFTEFTYAEAIAIAQRNMQENCPSVSRVFLARIAELEAALLAKSAAYEALVAGCSELAAKFDRQAEENYTDRGNALSRCADDIRLLLVREGGDD